MDEKLFGDVNLNRVEGMIDDIISKLEMVQNLNISNSVNSIGWQSEASSKLKTAFSNNNENIDVLLTNLRDFKKATILARQIDDIE